MAKGRLKGTSRTKRTKRGVVKPLKPLTTPAHRLYTNGEITECHYLQGLAEYVRTGGYGTTVYKPRVVKGSPRAVIEEMLRERQELIAAYGNEVDNVQFWAVVDCDDYSVDELVAASTKCPDNAALLLSNPCFEYWLLLHTCNQGGEMNQGDCQRRLSQKLEGYDHSEGRLQVRFEDTLEMLKTATDRARKKGAVLSKALRIHNPRTDMWKLMDAIFSEPTDAEK